MGLKSIWKSQVSKLCKDIDEWVTAFLERLTPPLIDADSAKLSPMVA